MRPTDLYDFRPILEAALLADPGDMTIARRLRRVLLIAGVGAWLAGLTAALITSTAYPSFPVWAAFSVVFLGSFLWAVFSRSPNLIATAAQSASVIVMVATLANGYEGLLLVVVAVELALQTRRTIGLAWIAAQSVAFAVAASYHWSPQPALLISVPYFGFQLLMFVAVRLFVEEHDMRERIAAANEKLLALQTELIDKSRVEERLRIAQDLHDSLGHHLVALGLHLEAAAHESEGAARAAVRTAQGVARAALRDVKAIVRKQSEEMPVDLPKEIRQLADELAHPKVHFKCSPDLLLEDARMSRTLFRVVQEIVTNAIRHGEARNLWIDIDDRDDRVVLAARDDGPGTVSVTEGFGLSGMRRRLEELGGTMSAAALPTGGFEVRAELPHEARAAR
jgi:signal transduction histidine kinase